MKKNNKSNPNAKELSAMIFKWHTHYLVNVKQFKENTLKSYTLTLKLFGLFLLQEKGINSYNLNEECFSVKTLDEWRVWLIHVRKLKPQSVNQKIAAILNLLHYIGQSVKWSHIYTNAKEHVKYLKAEVRPEPEGLTHKAVKALFSVPDTNTSKGLRNLCIMMVQYQIAGRINEVLALKVRNLYLDGKDPHISLYSSKGNLIKTNHISDELVEWLRVYIYKFHGRNPLKDDYLFYSPIGGRKTQLSQDAVDKFLKQYAAKANTTCPEVPLDLSSHDWRHTAGNHWREDGLNIVEIQKLMGHKQISSTMVYQHVRKIDREKAVSKMGNDISKEAPKIWESEENSDLLKSWGF